MVLYMKIYEKNCSELCQQLRKKPVCPKDILTKNKFYSRNILDRIDKQKFRISDYLENTRYGSVADDPDAAFMRDEYIEDIIERFYA